MNKREKTSLGIAAAVAVLFIAVNAVPSIFQLYEERADNIERIKLDIAREGRIIIATGDWRDRKIETLVRLEDLQSDIFQGETLSLVSADIQRVLRQYASEAGISVSSTKLAENRETEGWLLVEQEMSFRMPEQGKLLEFFEMLEQSKPHLEVTEFNFRRNRSQYTGSITVVGFSRLESSQQASNGSR